MRPLSVYSDGWLDLLGVSINPALDIPNFLEALLCSQMLAHLVRPVGEQENSEENCSPLPWSVRVDYIQMMKSSLKGL